MKIISQPNFKDWKHQVTCHQCTAVLEIDANDILCFETQDEMHGRPAGIIETYKVVCVVCNNSINIQQSELPKGLCLLIKQKNCRRSSSYYYR